ncbi:hypothetical protein LR48_Vigan347s001000 [Vigna angularis]|uniref:Uncharacterized protein n=1 Tax=Phaseolus angularis TaxID=3914 RepID=A0A0L9T9D4_PHAAN|nr:hypothetical protein LR48_Vigan347s001000 [Vigna angularis]
MTDSRRPRRRTGGASSSRPRTPHPTSIEGWISDPEKQVEFAHFWQERVSIDGEHTQSIQSIETKIGETTFRQMGFVAHGRVLVHKDDDNQDEENDDMDAHMVEPIRVVGPSKVGPSTMPSSSSLSIEEYFVNLSKQMEDMSFAHQARFNQIIEMQ